MQNKTLTNFFECEDEKEVAENYKVGEDLPQTPPQFLQFLIDASNKIEVMDIAPMIHKLLRTCTPEEVEKKVIKFFKSFDESQFHELVQKNR